MVFHVPICWKYIKLVIESRIKVRMIKIKNLNANNGYREIENFLFLGVFFHFH